MQVASLLKHILFLSRHFRAREARYVTMVILIELDIATEQKGFEYLVKAITLYQKDPQQTITQELYTAVAMQCDPGVNAGQVDQAIRRTIQNAWENRDQKSWKCYFGPLFARPSNSHFISKIARVVDLWEACCRAESEVVVR